MLGKRGERNSPPGSPEGQAAGGARCTGLKRPKLARAFLYFCRVLGLAEAPPYHPEKRMYPVLKPQQDRKFHLLLERAREGEHTFYLMPKMDGYRVTITFSKNSVGRKISTVKQVNGKVIEELSEKFIDLTKIPDEIFDLTCVMEGELFCVVNDGDVKRSVGFNGVRTAIDLWFKADLRPYLKPNMELRFAAFNVYSLGEGEGMIHGSYFDEISKPVNFCRAILKDQPNAGAVFCGGLYCKDGQVFKDKECTKCLCDLRDLRRHVFETQVKHFQKHAGFGEGFVIYLKGPYSAIADTGLKGRDERACKLKDPPLGGHFQVSRYATPPSYVIFDGLDDEVATLRHAEYGHIFQQLGLRPSGDTCVAYLVFTWGSLESNKITGIHRVSEEDRRPRHTELCVLREVLQEHPHFKSVTAANRILKAEAARIDDLLKGGSRGSLVGMGAASKN